MKLLVFGCIKLPQQFGGPTVFLAYSYLLWAAGPMRLNISRSLFADTQTHTHSTRALFNLFKLLKFWINPGNCVHLWNLQLFPSYSLKISLKRNLKCIITFLKTVIFGNCANWERVVFDADKRWVNNTCWNYCFFLTLLLLLLYVTVCGTPVVFFHIAVAAFTLENKHYFPV